MGTKLENSLKQMILEAIALQVDDIVYWVRNELFPEDIFEQEELEYWAKKNGFIKEL